MSKSNCGNNMTGGVAVCYWPLLVENEIAMFPLNARDFCPGLVLSSPKLTRHNSNMAQSFNLSLS